MTPHIGIASVFIIGRDDIMKPFIFDTFGKMPRSMSYHTTYAEFYLSNTMLTEPFDMVNIYHNISDLSGLEREGISSGWMHVIDVKDQLELYDENPNADREVIYNGDRPLKIIEMIPHTAMWKLRYRFNPKSIGTIVF